MLYARLSVLFILVLNSTQLILMPMPVLVPELELEMVLAFESLFTCAFEL